MLRSDVDVGEILPIVQEKTKGVVIVGGNGQDRRVELERRCFGHGGDARDGFVGLYILRNVQRTDCS